MLAEFSLFLVEHYFVSANQGKRQWEDPSVGMGNIYCYEQELGKVREDTY